MLLIIKVSCDNLNFILILGRVGYLLFVWE